MNQTIQFREEQLAGKVWRDPATGKIYAGKIGETRMQAQLLQDLSTIESQVVLEEVLGLARPSYSLRYACRIINMPELTMSIDVATKLTAEEDVLPLVEAQLKAQNYSRINFDLTKDVVHIAIADEDQKRSVHDVLRLHTDDAAGALAASENGKVKTVLESATQISGSDWGGSNNPYDDIVNAVSTIEGNGYPADFIAAHPLVWGDFFSNDKVKFAVAAGGMIQYPTARTFPVPGLPGITGISDSAMTNINAVIGSTRAPAVIFGEGPSESARYRNEPAGYDAFIIRHWYQPKLVVAGAIRKLTGVHA